MKKKYDNSCKKEKEANEKYGKVCYIKKSHRKICASKLKNNCGETLRRAVAWEHQSKTNEEWRCYA